MRDMSSGTHDVDRMRPLSLCAVDMVPAYFKLVLSRYTTDMHTASGLCWTQECSQTLRSLGSGPNPDKMMVYESSSVTRTRWNITGHHAAVIGQLEIFESFTMYNKRLNPPCGSCPRKRSTAFTQRALHFGDLVEVATSCEFRTREAQGGALFRSLSTPQGARAPRASRYLHLEPHPFHNSVCPTL
jgi:hypothetical protein